MRARCPSDRASTFSNDFDPEISGRISRYKNMSWHIKHHDRPVLSHILHHDHRVQQIGKGESVASSDIQSIIFDGNDLSGQRTNGHVLRETDIKGQDYLIVAPVSMRICLQFLKDPSLFRKFSFDERSNMRGALRHQLHQVSIYDIGLCHIKLIHIAARLMCSLHTCGTVTRLISETLLKAYARAWICRRRGRSRDRTPRRTQQVKKAVHRLARWTLYVMHRSMRDHPTPTTAIKIPTMKRNTLRPLRPRTIPSERFLCSAPSSWRRSCLQLPISAPLQEQS